MSNSIFTNNLDDSEEVEMTIDLKRTSACLHSVRFWQYFFLMILSQMFGGYFSYVFKQIGLANNIEDSYLTFAASAASIVQCITRLVFGMLYDKYGFRPLFILLMCVNIANSLLCYPLRSSTSLFLICIETNYLVIAGVFAIFPVPVTKTFGPRFGTAVYAMVLIGSPLSALLITF